MAKVVNFMLCIFHHNSGKLEEKVNKAGPRLLSLERPAYRLARG